jgi:aromatic ring-opening dioxygenase catalytic subunit (LigB family)
MMMMMMMMMVHSLYCSHLLPISAAPRNMHAAQHKVKFGPLLCLSYHASSAPCQ